MSEFGAAIVGANGIKELLTHASLEDFWQAGRRVGLRLAWAALNLRNDEILLACGEMTAQELRSVRAVLEWRQRAIRSLIKESEK